MSDLKKAAIGLAKLDAQVDQAGLHITDGRNQAFGLGVDDHVISGMLDGTHTLSATHSILNVTDAFDFTISSGHDFNLTIQGFHPQTYSAGQQPNWDGIHDLLFLNWDPSTGVTTFAQAQADEHVHVVGHDVVFNIDAQNVHGSITFTGLADYLSTQSGDTWGWHNNFVHVN